MININKETWKTICPKCKELRLAYKKVYEYCRKESMFTGFPLNSWEICGHHYEIIHEKECDNCKGKTGMKIYGKWYSDEVVLTAIKAMNNITTPYSDLAIRLRSGKPIPPPNRISIDKMKEEPLNQRFITILPYRFGVRI